MALIETKVTFEGEVFRAIEFVINKNSNPNKITSSYYLEDHCQDQENAYKSCYLMFLLLSFLSIVL